MGDTGDDYKAMKEHSQKKRANNREGSAEMLTEAGIEYESKNNGAHLIVDTIKYPKIQTLWKRDKDNKFCIMPGEYSDEIYSQIPTWHVTEKIDGMNMRIGKSIEYPAGGYIRGRTDKADIPGDLHNHCFGLTSPMGDRFKEIFPDSEDAPICLYGEGYGAGIQKGGGYSADKRFILFDVRVGDWWLDQDDVRDVAEKLGCPYVPSFGIMTTDRIVRLVQERHVTCVDANPCDEKIMEGIVARSYPQLFDKFGNRVMWKLKVKDYVALEAK